jgi:methyl-accepting chemotaxis protein
MAGLFNKSRDKVAEQAAIDEDRLNAGMVKALGRSQAIIEFSLDGEILSANENFLHTLGYSFEEIRGKHHSIFVDPAYRQTPEYRAFWERLGRGEFDAGKYLRIGKGGKQVWIQASYNPILDANGKPYRVVKFANDITDAENQARASLFKSAAFEGSSVAMMMIDRDFNVTYVNEATKKLLTNYATAFRAIWPSFDPDRIVGSCIDMFHKSPAHQRQILSNPSRLPYRTDISVGDMKFALSVGGVFDANRNYVGNVLEWDDVTATRLNAGMLTALNRSQAIIEFSLDGKVLNANDNFLRTLGYTLDEIRGQHHSLFVDPAYRQSADYRAFWEKLGRGEFDAGKYLRIGKGGKEVWIQASYNPIVDGNGKAFKVVKFADDITAVEFERRQNEEERAARAAEQARVVQSLAGGLKQLSDGNLTSRINETFPADYEQLRSDFNAAMGNLQETMKTVVVNAGGIRSGAGEISQAADDLSKRTEQQAASLEETAAALDEITATVKKTAAGAIQANGVVGGTRADAEASGQVVRETVAAMSEIEKSAKQISQIIGVIDEIAFQTNLLALNAGVEAARAGDAGRGFAVVASEVRLLAQRSSEAAKEIKSLISASSSHVETGVELVGQAGKALQQIVGKVAEISTLVSEIAASAQEQATGLAQVNTAVNQMDQVTQQNAAMVEQSTAASHSLTQEAEELMRLVAQFQTGEASGAGHAPGRQAHARPSQSQPAVLVQRQRAVAFASRGSAALKQDPVQQKDDWQEF